MLGETRDVKRDEELIILLTEGEIEAGA